MSQALFERGTSRGMNQPDLGKSAKRETSPFYKIIIEDKGAQMAAYQGQVLTTANTWLGQIIQWVAWSPPASGTMVLDVFGGTVPNLNNQLQCCCWEFPILAALHTNNALTVQRAQQIYTDLASDQSNKADGLITLASKTSWKGIFRQRTPAPGDLIFFSTGNCELAHVAMATGQEIGGETACISHWSADHTTGPVLARVSMTTVENLKRVTVAGGLGGASCFFANPIW